MQATLINQMHQLQQAGYRFTRVQAHYALEELLPAAMDAHLDQLADTPAFVDRGQLKSGCRQFLLITYHQQVLKTLWLHGPQSERQLARWCTEQLAQLPTRRDA